MDLLGFGEEKRSFPGNVKNTRLRQSSQLTDRRVGNLFNKLGDKPLVVYSDKF